MNGQKIGYKRVSTVDQREDRQLEGMSLDKTFIDKTSGKNIERPALTEMLSYVREGDHVFVHSMDRLARNLDDLRKTVRQLTDNNIQLTFVTENLSFTADRDPMSELMLSMFGAFAEFERTLIKERQREGIELAKKRGVYKGKQKSLNQKQIDELKRRAKLHENRSHLAREFGISRTTLYVYLNN